MKMQLPLPVLIGAAALTGAVLLISRVPPVDMGPGAPRATETVSPTPRPTVPTSPTARPVTPPAGTSQETARQIAAGRQDAGLRALRQRYLDAIAAGRAERGLAQLAVREAPAETAALWIRTQELAGTPPALRFSTEIDGVTWTGAFAASRVPSPSVIAQLSPSAFLRGHSGALTTAGATEVSVALFYIDAETFYTVLVFR